MLVLGNRVMCRIGNAVAVTAFVIALNDIPDARYRPVTRQYAGCWV